MEYQRHYFISLIGLLFLAVTAVNLARNDLPKLKVSYNKSNAQSASLVITPIITSQAGRLDWPVTGNKLVLDRLGIDNFYDVYTMNIDGTNSTCLTCDKPELAPNKHIGNPAWHPSGNYIVFQSQNDHAGFGTITDWFANPGSGINNDLWVMNSSGTQFWKLVDVPNAVGGILHPHFSNSGNQLLWAERISATGGTTGTWAIKLADFSTVNSTPSISNIRTYQPGAQHLFYETDGFSPDDTKLIFSGNLESGQTEVEQDVYVFDVATQALTNLTNSADWDEHPHFSPDGSKIVWMSSKGYGNDGSQTDYWMMDASGQNKTRLTYFNEAGHAEYRGRKVAAADLSWSPDSKRFVGYLLEDFSTGTAEDVIVTLGATPVPGDLNLDHIVNSIDWSIMNSKWFTSDSTADLNHDGIVNSIDYSILNSNWFKNW